VSDLHVRRIPFELDGVELMADPQTGCRTARSSAASPAAVPHINTKDSPMPIARDGSWRIMAEQPTATGTRSGEELR